jgi:TIR domain
MRRVCVQPVRDLRVLQIARMSRKRKEVKKPKLMISYCHADKGDAQRIKGLLDSSFEVLIDENYFELSRSTKPEMKRMVGDADVVLVLLSPASVASNAVRFEVSCALAREKDEQRKVLFAGMIESCKPMPEWDGARLWANLHSSFPTEFRKLKRSLLSASARALPKATMIPDSQGLYQLAKDSIKRSGFSLRGDIELITRGARLSDNPLTASVLNVDGIRNFRACIATYDRWSVFFYFPKAAVRGRAERLFSLERTSVRGQIGARLGGYLAHVDDPVKESPEIHALIKLFRRYPKQIDVLFSPYPVGLTYPKAFDVNVLSWAGSNAVLLYKLCETNAGYATLPLFVAARLQSLPLLTDAMRALKAALRTELNLHGVAAQKWSFLGDQHLGKLAHMARPRRKSGKPAKSKRSDAKFRPDR